MARIFALATVFAMSVAAAGQPPAAPAPQARPGAVLSLLPSGLTAAQVIEKNIDARGGIDAWRRIQTLAWVGRVEGGSPVPLPFRMEMQRPNKTRFEVTVTDRRFVRVFDGTHGWRVRPGSSGAPETRAFSREEEDYARNEFVIDGALIDYQAKGVRVRLAGIDEIEGRKAHLIEATLPSGGMRRIWIDAETFLEMRIDRPSTNPVAKGAPSSVYYSNWRSIEGVMIPLTIESRSATAPLASEKLVIEKVAFNPKLAEMAFARPAGAWQKNAIVRIGDGPAGAVRP